MRAFDRRARRDGLRKYGQASRHRPQLMHGYSLSLAVSSSVNTSTPEQPFKIGTSRLAIGHPIIGPPMIISRLPGLSPPQNFTTSRTGVPSGTIRLAGYVTPGPATVTTRSI